MKKKETVSGIGGLFLKVSVFDFFLSVAVCAVKNAYFLHVVTF